MDITVNELINLLVANPDYFMPMYVIFSYAGMFFMLRSYVKEQYKHCNRNGWGDDFSLEACVVGTFLASPIFVPFMLIWKIIKYGS